MRKYITAITTEAQTCSIATRLFSGLIKSFHMAVFIFLQFTVKLFQRKLIWEQKHLCMKCRCTKRSSKASTAVWVTKVKLAFTWLNIFLCLQCKFLWMWEWRKIERWILFHTAFLSKILVYQSKKQEHISVCPHRQRQSCVERCRVQGFAVAVRHR